MNWPFLNPLFLFGLAAAVLPILIHRLVHRKAVARDFSAVRLLLQSERITTRPRRLKHIFLLALRILAVLTLVILMARPFLKPENLLAGMEGGAKALILDNSLSMGFREERGERFGLAKKAAEEIIRKGKGPILIIPTAHEGDQASDLRWTTPEEALRNLDQTTLSYNRGNPASALGQAYRGLREIKGSKAILIISDLARGDWEGFDLAKMGNVSAEAGIHLLRIGGGKRDSNFAVKRVGLAEGDAVAGVPGRLEVKVVNFSDQDGSPLVQLYLAGTKVEQKKADLKAGGEASVYFELFLDRPGWKDGEIRLTGDSCPGDDIFYFSLRVADRVKVLIVDGDPGRSLKESESYYLLHALNPGGGGDSPFVSQTITEEELSSADLKSYDILFLLNVSRPSGSKVSSFLEAGKTVFIFLGDRINPDDYHRIPLFPWVLREIRKGGDVGIVPAKSESDSPNPFSGPVGESLKKVSIQRYFKVEGGGKKVLNLRNGDPLLLESNLGKGQIHLFASTANLKWNDLPLKGAYLPLIQTLLRQAAGISKDSLPETLRMGEPLPRQSLSQLTGIRGGPGIYQVSLPPAEKRVGVNPPLQESDLSKITEEELQKRFGEIKIKVTEYKNDIGRDTLAGRRELWPFFLAFLLVILAVEMGVAGRT